MFGDILLGHEIRDDAAILQCVCGSRADGRHLHAAEDAGIQSDLAELFPEELHTVDRSENHPLVTGELQNRGLDLVVIVEMLHGNSGEFMHARTVAAQNVHQSACLFAGAGHDDALAEHGLFLEPCELVMQGADTAHDDDGRSLPVALFRFGGDVLQRGDE